MLASKPSVIFLLLQPLSVLGQIVTITNPNLSVQRFFKIEEHRNYAKLPMDVCGLQLEDRIVGGVRVGLGEYPWAVRIGYEVCGEVEYRCGGALVTRDTVITAAHCLTNLPEARCEFDFSSTEVKTVILGEMDTRTDPDCVDDICADPAKVVGIQKFLMHPEFNSTTVANDIAIIKLAEPVEFNEWISPICLPHGDTLLRNFTNTKAIVVGWGLVDPETTEMSEALLQVRAPLLEMSACHDTYEEYGFVVSDVGQICAGGVEGQDSCKGDSGGPLMAVGASDAGPTFQLLGIVSFGLRLCGTSQPTIYTNVRAYGEWIMDHLI